MPLLRDRQEWYDHVATLVGGLASQVPPENTPGSAALDLTWLDEHQGELRKTPGRLRRASLPGGGAVRGIYFWFRKNDDNRVVIHTNDRAFQSSDFLSFQEIAVSLVGTKRDKVSYAPVAPDDTLLWADGVNPVTKFDGTTASPLVLPSGVTNARLVKYWKRRTILFQTLVNGTWERLRVHWAVAGAGQFENWSAADGSGNIDYADGGSQIVQVEELNDTLVLFKTNRLGVLHHTGNEGVPFRLQDFPEAPGTIFPWSVTPTPGGLLYLAYDGLRIFDGDESRLLTPQVVLELTAIAADQRAAVNAVWDDRFRRYLLTVPKPGSSDCDRVWSIHIKDPLPPEVYKRDQVVSHFGVFYRTSPLTCATLPVECRRVPFACNDPTIISAYPVIVSGNYAGEIFEHELLTDDNDQPVTAYIVLGPFPKDADITQLLDKRLREVRLRVRKFPNTTLKVSVRRQDDPEWHPIGTIDLAATRDRRTHALSADISGEQFFVRIENDERFASPRFYLLSVYGAHTGALRK